MSSNLRWDKFAEVTVKKLVQAKEGDAFLIMADTSIDPGLAQACLSAGLRAGADTQLLTYDSWGYDWPVGKEFGPIASEAIRASRLILEFHPFFSRTEAAQAALAKGARILHTEPQGSEDFLISGVLDVDYEAMVRNGELVAKLWDETKECAVVSEGGTDIRFNLAPRKSYINDGVLREDGVRTTFPGVQVGINAVERRSTARSS